MFTSKELEPIFNFSKNILNIIEKNKNNIIMDELFFYILDNWDSEIKVGSGEMKISTLYHLVFGTKSKWYPIELVFSTSKVLVEKCDELNINNILRSDALPLSEKDVLYFKYNYIDTRAVRKISAKALLDRIVFIPSTLITRLLLRGSISFENCQEDIILELAKSGKTIFYLMCNSKKSSYQLSEETLDKIVENPNFFSEKYAPTMSYDKHTLAYQNVRTTILCQNNISKKTMTKLLEYAIKNPELLNSLRRNKKKIKEKFKNSSEEIQLLLNLYELV